MTQNNLLAPLPNILPKCNLINPQKLSYAKSIVPTREERILATALQEANIPFLQNYVITGFIVDFVIRLPRIVIEVNSFAHDPHKDAKRKYSLLKSGHHTIDIDNWEIQEDVNKVVMEIARAIELLEKKPLELKNIPTFYQDIPDYYKVTF